MRIWVGSVDGKAEAPCCLKVDIGIRAGVDDGADMRGVVAQNLFETQGHGWSFFICKNGNTSVGVPWPVSRRRVPAGAYNTTGQVPNT